MALLSNPKELVSQLGELLCENTGGGVVRVDYLLGVLFSICYLQKPVWSVSFLQWCQYPRGSLPIFLSVCLYCKAWGNMECVALLVLSLINCTFKTCLWGSARKSFSLPFLISLLAGKSRLEWRYSWASKNWAKEDWDCWECTDGYMLPPSQWLRSQWMGSAFGWFFTSFPLLVVRQN